MLLLLMCLLGVTESTLQNICVVPFIIRAFWLFSCLWWEVFVVALSENKILIYDKARKEKMLDCVAELQCRLPTQGHMEQCCC